jgi:hypothetical protein
MSGDNATEDSGSWADDDFVGLPDRGTYHDLFVKQHNTLSENGQTLKK